MSFSESNTVEAHLREILAGAASARPAQLSTGLARTGGKIAGLGWHYVAPAGLPRQPQELLVEPNLCLLAGADSAPPAKVYIGFAKGGVHSARWSRM